MFPIKTKLTILGDDLKYRFMIDLKNQETEIKIEITVKDITFGGHG